MGVEEAVQLDAEALAREALAPPPPQPDLRSVLLDTVQRLRRVLTEHEAVVVGELGPIRTVVRRDPREATSDTWRIADLRVDAVIRQRAGSPVPPVIHLEWFESAHTFEPRPDHRRYVLTGQQRADTTAAAAPAFPWLGPAGFGGWSSGGTPRVDAAMGY